MLLDVDGSPGDILADFAALAVAEGKAGEAVASFVGIHGPLEGGWIEHARDVAAVLSVKEALAAGRAPDPHHLQGPDPAPFTAAGYRLRFERHVRGAKSRVPPQEHSRFQEGAEEVWAEEVVGHEVESRRRARRVDDLKALARKGQPITAEEWWGWIAFKVNGMLREHPACAQLEPSDGGGLRLALRTSGVLPRVALALAREVSGVGQLASCSACRRFYTPARAPKSGQHNYCPACRAARVPQRLHARTKRRT